MRHAGAVSALVFSPDGKFLASGGGDTVRVWDLTTGKPVMTGTINSVGALDFTRDGKTLAAVGRHGDLCLWNVATGQQTQRFAGQLHSKVQAMRFSPDGKHLSLVDDQGNVLFKDAVTGKNKNAFRSERDYWFRLALTADGKRACSAGHDYAVCVWDVATGKRLLKLPAHKDHVYGAAFSPDGRYLASGGRSNKIHLWELATGQAVYTLPSNDHVLAFSPNGRTLVSAAGHRGASVQLWDVATGKPGRQLSQLGGVETIAFSPDGQWLATGGGDGVLRMWDVAKGREKQLVPGPAGGTPHAFLDAGRTLVVDAPSGMAFFEVVSPAAVPAWGLKEQRRLEDVHGLLAPDGKTLVAGAAPYQNIFLWDVARQTELYQLAKRSSDPAVYVYAPDGTTVAVAGSGAVELFHAGTGKSVRRMQIPRLRGIAVAFSPDGRTLVTAGGERDSTVRFWNVATGDEVRNWSLPAERHSRSAPDLTFSPSGKTLVLRSYGGLQFWDVGLGIKVFDLKHSGPFTFSPDGRLLATGERNGYVRLWEVATGQAIAELSGHDGPVLSLLFSPDGRLLATGSADHTLLLWDVSLGRLGGAPAQKAKPDDDERAKAWTALSEKDAGAAQQALGA